MAFEDLIKDGIVTIEGDKENLTALEKIVRINWLLRQYKEAFEKMTSVDILHLKVGENDISFDDIVTKYHERKSVFVVQRVGNQGEVVSQTPMLFALRFSQSVHTIPLTTVIVTESGNIQLHRGSLERTDDGKVDFYLDTTLVVDYDVVAEIVDEFPDVKGDIESLFETVTSLDNAIDGLTSRMVAAEENIDDINDTITAITPKVNRALLTPISTPTEKLLTGVDETNSQMMVKLGEGLELDGTTSPFTLNATGGSGGDNVVIYEGYIDFDDNALRMSPITAQTIIDTVNSGKTVIIMAEGAETTGHTTTYVFVVDYVDDAGSSSGYSFSTSVSNGLKVVANGVSHDTTIFNILSKNRSIITNAVDSIEGYIKANGEYVSDVGFRCLTLPVRNLKSIKYTGTIKYSQIYMAVFRDINGNGISTYMQATTEQAYQNHDIPINILAYDVSIMWYAPTAGDNAKYIIDEIE